MWWKIIQPLTRRFCHVHMGQPRGHSIKTLRALTYTQNLK